MKTVLRESSLVLAVIAVAWVLLAGQGLCGNAPEPLQNRSGSPTESADTPGAEKNAPGGVTATGSGGNQDATVVVTPSVVVPGGTAQPVGPLVGPDGGTVPASPETAKGQAPLEAPDVKGHVLVPVVPGGGDSRPLVPPAPETAKDKGKAKGDPLVPDVTATGKGGDQHTKVLVAPQAVVPVGSVKGDGSVKPSTPLGPASGEPVTVPPNGAVIAADGKPVALPPGQAVTLPQGGKMVGPDGQAVPLPPGARVIMPATAMSPADFLPKTGGKPEGKPDVDKTPAGKPDAEPKKSVTPSPIPGKPGAQSRPAKQKAVPPPQAEPPPAKLAAASKPGERIKIPQDACDKRTVDFLSGCWRGEVLLQDHTRVIIRLCFDGSGVGKRIDRYLHNGKQCAGATRASWSGEGLSFSFNKLYCTNGTVMADVPIVCKGCGENTHCIGTEYRTNVGAVGKTNFVLVKD